MQTVITPIADAASLHAALTRWCDALEAAAPELNALDGRLGDGDLGATLFKVRGQRARAACRSADLPGGDAEILRPGLRPRLGFKLWHAAGGRIPPGSSHGRGAPGVGSR